MPLVIATPYKARIISECGVFTIVSIDAVNESFTIEGDHTECFGAGETFEVTGTALNDGTYTVHVTKGSVYDSGNDQTIVYVNENVVSETPPSGTYVERVPPTPVFELTPVIDVIDGESGDGGFTVTGDLTGVLVPGSYVEPTPPCGEDNSVFTVVDVEYDALDDETTVYVLEPVACSGSPPEDVRTDDTSGFTTITTQGYVDGSTLKTKVYVQGNVVGALGGNLDSGGSASVSGTSGSVNDGRYDGIDDLAYDPSTNRTTWTTESMFAAGDTNSQTCVSVIGNTTPITTYINTSAGGSYSQTPFVLSPTSVTADVYESYVENISGDIRDHVGVGEYVEISGTSSYDGSYLVLNLGYEDVDDYTYIELDGFYAEDPGETDITVDLPGTIVSGDGPFAIAEFYNFDGYYYIRPRRKLNTLLSVGDAFIVEGSLNNDGVFTITDINDTTFTVNRYVNNEAPSPGTGTKLNFGTADTPVVYTPTSYTGSINGSYVNIPGNVAAEVGVGEEVEISGTSSYDGSYLVLNLGYEDVDDYTYIELDGVNADPEETDITVDLPGSYVSGEGPFSVYVSHDNRIEMGRKIDFSTIFAVGDYIKMEDANDNDGYYIIAGFSEPGYIEIEGDFRDTVWNQGTVTKAPPASSGTPTSKVVFPAHTGNMSSFMPVSSKIKIVNASDVDNNGWKTVDINTGSQVTLAEALDDGDTNLSGGLAYVSDNKLIKDYSPSVSADSAELQISGVWSNLVNYVGQTLEISGASNPANNSTFTVSAVRLGSESTYITLSSGLVAGDANLLAGLATISFGTFTNATASFVPSEDYTQLRFNGPIAAPLSSLETGGGDRIVISGASYSQNNRSYVVLSVSDGDESIYVDLDATCEHVRGSDLNLNNGTAVVKHSYVITSYTTATGSVGRLVLDGDLTSVFAPGQPITIGGSSLNDGSKTVSAVTPGGTDETYLYLTTALTAGDTNLSAGVAEIVTAPYPICNYITENTPGQFTIEGVNLAYMYPAGSSVTISGSSVPGDNGTKTVISSTFDGYNTVIEVSDYIDGSGGGVVEYDIVTAGQSPTVGNAVDRQVREWGNDITSVEDDFINTGTYESKAMDLSYIKRVKIGAARRHFGLMAWCDALPVKQSSHQIRAQLYRLDDNMFGGSEMVGSSLLIASPSAKMDYSHASYVGVQTLTDKRSVVVYNTNASPTGPRVALLGHQIDKDGATLSIITGKTIVTTTNTKCGPITSSWGLLPAATDCLQTVFPEYGSERVVVIAGYGNRGIATVKVTADDKLVTNFAQCGSGGGGQGVGLATAIAQVSKDTFVMVFDQSDQSSYHTECYLVTFQLVREPNGVYGVRYINTGTLVSGPYSGGYIDERAYLGNPDRDTYGKDSQTMTIATIPESYTGSSIKAIIAARRHMGLFSINLSTGQPTRIGSWYQVITASERGSHMFSPSISYNNGEFMLYYFGQTAGQRYAHHKLHRFSVNLTTGAFTEQTNSTIGSLDNPSGLVNGQGLSQTTSGVNGVFNGVRRARRKIVWYYDRGFVLIDGGTEINSTSGSNNQDVFYRVSDD